MINSKQNCIDSLSEGLSRTANWRRNMQERYPSDVRNGKAADRLHQMAAESGDLSDEAWEELRPFYSWCSEPWSEAVSKAGRLVEFSRAVRTFPALIDNLIGILSSGKR